MKRVLMAAYMMDPGGGSEGALGWNRAWSMALRYDVTVLTLDHPERRARIEAARLADPAKSLAVEYLPQPPRGWRPPEPNPLMWFISNYQAARMYNGWAANAARRAVELHAERPFDLLHHVTYAGLYHGTCLSAVPPPVPLVIGPVGSGVRTHPMFHRYLGRDALSERLRSLALSLSLAVPSTNRRASRAVRRSALVIACNRETEALARRLGATRIRQMWDSTLDESFFEPVPVDRPVDRCELLWIGTLRPPKGLNLALDWLARTSPRRPWRMRILGDGPVKTAIPGWLKERGLEDRVEFLGRVPYADLRRFYAESHALVFSSFRDNGGNQLLEAMAQGCVPVALDQGGAGLLIESGVHGELIAVQDLDQVLRDGAAALERVIDDPGSWAARSAAARARAWEYRASTEVERIASAYDEALATGGTTN